MHLEPLDGGLGSRAEQAVHRAAVVSQAAEHPLDFEYARRTSLTSVAGTRSNGGRRPAPG
jgi:hypothetical protein